MNDGDRKSRPTEGLRGLPPHARVRVVRIRPLLTSWGLLTGLLVLGAWRYVAPPHHGHMVFADGLGAGQVTFGIDLTAPAFLPYLPAWLTFPGVGLLTGLILGTLGDRAGLRIRTNTNTNTGPSAGALILGAVLGIITGLAVCTALQWVPPTLYVAAAKGPPVGFPHQLTLRPLWRIVPVSGLLLGLIGAALLHRLGHRVTCSLQVDETQGQG